MKTMTSNNLSVREFFQLVVNSLLELCTNRVDGHCIVSIEGRLLLTLDTGEKVALEILQQTLHSSVNSVEDGLEDMSSLVCYFPVSYFLLTKNCLITLVTFI